MIDGVLGLDERRNLAYTVIGDAGWPCVLFFHGAPSSRLRLAYLESAFLAKQIRVVSPDRPGYGASTPQPNRTLRDWPHDVAALAAHLGVDRYITAGHSSGGPYALACAALIPHLVQGAIVLAGVTDMAWAPAWDGYLETEVELMRTPTEAAILARCIELYGPDGSGFLTASGIVFSDPDKLLYADEETSRKLAIARAEAFRQGLIGYAQDLFIQGQPWPFDSTSMAVPVTVAHGEFDTLVPLKHSEHTADLTPQATLQVLPGHGHFTVLSELPALADAMFASPPAA